MEALLRIQNEFVYSEPGTEEVKRLALEHRLSLPPDTILSFYDADSEANVVPLLSRLPCPTLVVHGTEDRLISFATAEYLTKEIPNAQLYAFEGKGHVPIFTATYEFCEVLRKFVREEHKAIQACALAWVDDEQQQLEQSNVTTRHLNRRELAER